MAMNGDDRGDTDYDAVTAINPNFSKLSSGEKATLKNYFEVLFTADTGYIQGNADVVPTAHSGENLSAPAGQPVLIPDTSNPGDPSTGNTTADEECVGKGSIQ
jgi:hypothetical protein